MTTTPSLRLRVRTRFRASATVAGFVLEHPEGHELPSWEPGAHVTVHLPTGIERQYSLCGDPGDRASYRIGVLREPDGRGGSAWMHARLHEGDDVTVTGPRNHFELVDRGTGHHFLAAGVGITPILPMVRHCEERGTDWRLTYLGRSRESMAFLDELAQLPGGRVHVHADDESGAADLGKLLASGDDDRLVYACGPEGLLRAVESVMAVRPPGALRVERFAPQESAPGRPFTVTFASSGVTAEVPADASILDVAQEHGIPVEYSCREGTCGTCETAVLGGRPDHRDSVLSPEERESGETMLICVSRSLTPGIELDL
ncbi:PDR/VanB family oxidoreductase [Streptomyces sp. NPDC048288]|uniref:PDR/VanB family oxidoreductase n=1 Tax=Streptomyces sp. NPDC048288 TaxID=3365529 RepID=UPI00371993F5